MKAKNILAFCLLCMIATDCSTESTCSTEPTFALFLVEKDNAEPQKVVLSQTPLLTNKDIIEYEWDSHSILITDDASKRIPTPKDIGTGGKAFVIVVNGERIYEGAFWLPYSSIAYFHPIIEVWGQTKGRIGIQRMFSKGNLTPDPRGDERIRKVLKKLGKLK